MSSDGRDRMVTLDGRRVAGRAKWMGRALGVLAAIAGGGGSGFAAGQSRFVSYSEEGECVAGHLYPAALCRSAFANARAEYEAKTPVFPSVGRCAQTFGSCMPWPPGAKRPAGFRPQWAGVDIVDTPHEKTVTPALAGRGRRVAFLPRPLTEPPPAPPLVVHAPYRSAGKPVVARGLVTLQPERAPPSAPPPPGSGFKLEDGVLTYPAPARYAPKNLPKQAE